MGPKRGGVACLCKFTMRIKIRETIDERGLSSSVVVSSKRGMLSLQIGVSSPAKFVRLASRPPSSPTLLSVGLPAVGRRSGSAGRRRAPTTSRARWRSGTLEAPPMLRHAQLRQSMQSGRVLPPEMREFDALAAVRSEEVSVGRCAIAARHGVHRSHNLHTITK